MISIPNLTKQDLSIFKGKTVILYSLRRPLVDVYQLFAHFDITPRFCYMEKSITKTQWLKDRVRGVRYITKMQLIEEKSLHNNCIVQIVEFDAKKIAFMQQTLRQFGFEISPFTSGQLLNSFSYLVILKRLKNPLLFTYKYRNWVKKLNKTEVFGWGTFKQNTQKNSIVLCSPQKTADHTLKNTFDFINEIYHKKGQLNPINYFFLWHSPHASSSRDCRQSFEKIKIIVGLREPISQNISVIYQRISGGVEIQNLLFSQFSSATNKAKKNIFESIEALFDGERIDVQLIWNIYTTQYEAVKVDSSPLKNSSGFIQFFIPQFSRFFFDITQYPFDKEKGYAIIKEKNIEMFIYQLEKLNDLVPELSAWIGVSFDKLVNGNQASDKWIADSYKQAQKEIEITQEYFDKCFDEAYVKHCYSEADIEKFKARWRPHIKKEA